MKRLMGKFTLIVTMIIFLSGCNNSDHLRNASIVSSSNTNMSVQTNNQDIQPEKQLILLQL